MFDLNTEVDQSIESGQGNANQTVLSTIPDVEIDDDDREIITSTDEIHTRGDVQDE